MDESTFEWDLSGRPMAAVNNIDPSSACIKMAAVGRRFRLGQLYDYKTDTILTGYITFLLICYFMFMSHGYCT